MNKNKFAIKPLIIIFLSLLGGNYLFGQQLPQYTQYMMNDFVLNPAIAGKTEHVWECRSNNRYQWIGITDAPRTYILSLHGPFINTNMGIGGLIYTDIVGPTRRIGAQLAYSYHLHLNKKWELNMGLAGGVLQYSIDGSKISLYSKGDPVVPGFYKSAVLPDFAMGLYLHGRGFYWGISTPQIFPATVKYDGFIVTNKSKIVPHFYNLIGYKWRVNRDWVIEPSALVKYVSPVPVKIDAGVRVIYQNKVWIGSNYRTKDAITYLMGYMHERWLMITYSYDMSNTSLQSYTTGTHEIMLGLNFHKPTTTYKQED